MNMLDILQPPKIDPPIGARLVLQFLEPEEYRAELRARQARELARQTPRDMDRKRATNREYMRAKASPRIVSVTGDMGEYWNDVKDARKERRAKYGVDCPGCRKKEPKRTPTVLLPQQRCKVCGYRDPRPREAE